MKPDLDIAELMSLGFARLGRNCKINRSVQFFGCEHIEIGDDVRVDAFCVLTSSNAGIAIGSNVHIGVGTFLSGSGGRIELEPFANLSVGVRIFTSSDDFVGGHLTGPTVPDKFKAVQTGTVEVRRHAIIGAGSIVLPGVELGRGSSVGAMSLVRRSVGAGEIVFGNPLRTHHRKRDLEKLAALERAFLSESGGVE